MNNACEAGNIVTRVVFKR